MIKTGARRVFLGLTLALVSLNADCTSKRSLPDQNGKETAPHGGMGGGGMMDRMPDWMMSDRMMDPGMMRDMRTIHDLLVQHEKIQRAVEDIHGGIRAVTTSVDPEVAGRIRALVPITGAFHYAMFGLRLTLPVRNKNQGLIEAAAAAEEAARKRREFAELAVRNEIAAAYAKLERARAASAVYRDRVIDASARNLDVLRQAYTLGQKNLLDYITEQRRFIVSLREPGLTN